MSLNTILQKIQQKGLIKSVLPAADTTPKATATPTSALSKSTPRPLADRPVDPVVARLKAARKAEREKKEQEMREKKGLQPKKETKTKARPSTKMETQSTNRDGAMLARNTKHKRFQVASISPHGAVQRPEKKTKMTFSELMKKASLIDHSKMSIAIKQKTKSPEASAPRRPIRKDDMELRGKNVSHGARSRVPEHHNRPAIPDRTGKIGRPASGSLESVRDGHSSASRGGSGETRSEVRTPLPVRKPSEKLQARLQKRRTARPGVSVAEEEDFEEDELDSFIASDEEEQESYGADYDRDEIWSIFNRGRKRSHYDQYDDEDTDDMEATGAEIFEEELLSKRRAMEEDMRELKEEQRLAALKQARKLKAGRK